jgi:hypothetical protein
MDIHVNEAEQATCIYVASFGGTLLGAPPQLLKCWLV